MQMFEQFHTDVLKNVITVRYRKAEFDGNGVHQAPVALDQSFPRKGISTQAERHQFRVRMFLVIGRFHYRGFLDFQKLSSAKKIITPDEMRTMMNRPDPISGLCTYFRYSWIAASMKTMPMARNMPPINSSHSCRSVRRRSPKMILSLLLMTAPRVELV